MAGKESNGQTKYYKDKQVMRKVIVAGTKHMIDIAHSKQLKVLVVDI